MEVVALGTELATGGSVEVVANLGRMPKLALVAETATAMCPGPIAARGCCVVVGMGGSWVVGGWWVDGGGRGCCDFDVVLGKAEALEDVAKKVLELVVDLLFEGGVDGFFRFRGGTLREECVCLLHFEEGGLGPTLVGMSLERFLVVGLEDFLVSSIGGEAEHFERCGVRDRGRRHV